MVDFNNLGVSKGKCHESAMKNCQNALYHIHVIFISDSCHFHGTFMPLSCHFHFNPEHGSPNSFMPFSWHFLPLQNGHSQVNQIHVTFMALS